MRTLVDETLTVTLTPKLRPTSTLALLRQRLYRTSEAPLKLLHVFYTLQPITTFNVKDKDKPKTDKEHQMLRLPGHLHWWTSRNLSTRLTEHKRATRNVTSTITLLNTIYFSNRLEPCDRYYLFYRLLSTTHFRTNATELELNSYRHRTNDLLTGSSKTNYERLTGQPTIWLTINDCLTLTIDGSKRTNNITSLHSHNITA